MSAADTKKAFIALGPIDHKQALLQRLTAAIDATPKVQRDAAELKAKQEAARVKRQETLTATAAFIIDWFKNFQTTDVYKNIMKLDLLRNKSQNHVLYRTEAPTKTVILFDEHGLYQQFACSGYSVLDNVETILSLGQDSDVFAQQLNEFVDQIHNGQVYATLMSTNAHL